MMSSDRPVRGVKRRLATALLLIAGLSACAGSAPRSDGSVRAEPNLRSEAQSDLAWTGRWLDDAVLELPLPGLYREWDPLAGVPDTQVNKTSFSGVDMEAAMRLLVAMEKSLSFSFADDAARRKPVSLYNVQGSLRSVLGRVCHSAGVHCFHVGDGHVEIRSTARFSIPLPTNQQVTAYMIAGINNVLSERGRVEDNGSTFTYSATVADEDAVQRFLADMRRRAGMISWSLTVWEVTDETPDGVPFDTIMTGGTKSPSGVFVAPDPVQPSRIEALIRQHARLGASVSTVLTMLSGTTAEYVTEEQQDYVTRESQGTLEIGHVVSGLRMKVVSSWQDDSIYGDFEIERRKLLDLTPAREGSATSLARQATRSFSSAARVRPGDGLLLTGLGGGFLSGSESGVRLVAYLRPTLILFRPAPGADATPFTLAGAS